MNVEAFEIPATITKAQLGECATHYGNGNETEFHGHAPGTLIYRTFIGDFDVKRRVLVGAHYFIAAKKPAPELFDFNLLLKREGKKNVSNDK